MRSRPSSQPGDLDERRAQPWIRRYGLLLLLLLGSFGCMLLAAQIALLGLRAEPIKRDVRSVVEVDYGAGERRAAPLVPQVIEAVKQDVEAVQTPVGRLVITLVPVVEVPTAAPTLVARVSPTPPPTLTSEPTSTATSPPVDTATPRTETAVPTATTEPPTPVPPSSTPTQPPPSPTATPEPPVWTPSATPVPPTATMPPTATPVPATPIPMPSDTPPAPITPTPSVTATPTATATPTPSNTPTSTPTATPTSNSTPTPTATPTPSPTPPLLVLAITPNATLEGGGGDPDFPVTVLGQGFVSPEALLGGNTRINIVSWSGSTITGTLSPNILAGIYGLSVRNSDNQTGVLPRAFTVHPRVNPSRTLNSGAAFLSTFGPLAPISEGDDDYVQVLFFDVPDGPDDPLYVRIFDADTGGMYDKTGLDGAIGDTMMTYILRGGTGAYSLPDAQSDHPGAGGISSGTALGQQVIGQDAVLDNRWLSLGIYRGQGELVGGRRVFKLVVQGTSGDDGNWYQVGLSGDPNQHLEVPGARLFAFSWCLVLPGASNSVALYPYMPVGANRVAQYNFDLDTSPGTGISLFTSLRDLLVTSVGLSGDAAVASQEFAVFSGERFITWSARYVAADFAPVANHFTVWFRADDATSLAIFTAPTLVSPP